MRHINTDSQKIQKLLTRGVEEVIVKEHLEEALRSGRKLRVKLGIDPTAPDLHLGHTVVLRKLRQFQDLGHTAILIIGDFTATVGDPTGRVQERKPLTREEVKRNAKHYLDVAGKVLNIRKTEVHRNGEWYFKEGLTELINLAGSGSLQQILHRADFKKRISEGHDITYLELFYPLFQGYDSVKIAADVEIGGTDQTFNLLMGRRVQRHFNVPEQDVITVPLIEGTDGVHKMSKSFGNYIGLEEASAGMFAKIMSIPDTLIDKYYTCLTDETRKTQDPREAKLELARIIVEMYHGKGKGEQAKQEFVNVFSEKGKPADIPTVRVGATSLPLVELLVKAGLTESKSEARRLIEQGGVRVNDVRKNDPREVIVIADTLIQVGPRRFVKVTK